MQGSFTIYPKHLKAAAEEYTEMHHILTEASRTLERIEGELKDSAYGDIRRTLNHLRESVIAESKSLKQLQNVLIDSIAEYTSTEQQLIGTPITSFIPSDPTDSSSITGNRSESNGNLNELLNVLLKYVGSTGSLSSSAAPFLKIFLNAALGEEIGPSIVAEVMRSPFNQFAFFANAAENGWASAFKDGVGLSPYYASGAAAADKTFMAYLKTALSKEMNSYKNFSTLSTGTKAVAKWAGVAVTGITNSLENYEEYAGGSISAERAIAETVIETGVDVGVGALATAGTAAGLAALGFAGAPVIAVAALGTGVVVGANWLCEAITDKDIGELFADGICDMGEIIAGWFD